MTREQAVERLKNDWHVPLGGPLCVDRDKKDKFLEAIGLAVIALQEPERKTGRWEKETEFSEWVCSNCKKSPKTILGVLPNYCPNCGAKMGLLMAT